MTHRQAAKHLKADLRTANLDYSPCRWQHIDAIAQAVSSVRSNVQKSGGNVTAFSSIASRSRMAQILGLHGTTPETPKLEIRASGKLVFCRNSFAIRKTRMTPRSAQYTVGSMLLTACLAHKSSTHADNTIELTSR